MGNRFGDPSGECNRTINMFLPKIRHGADIPNTEGFKLTAILKDGSRVKTVVSKDKYGMHFLTGVDLSQLFTWEPR